MAQTPDQQPTSRRPAWDDAQDVCLRCGVPRGSHPYQCDPATVPDPDPRDRTVTVGELVDYINGQSAVAQDAAEPGHPSFQYWMGQVDALGQLAVWLVRRDPS